jgi:hypothetical protein
MQLLITPYMVRNRVCMIAQCHALYIQPVNALNRYLVIVT